MNQALNIIKNAFKGQNIRVMSDKLLKRLEPNTQDKATAWAKKFATDFSDYAVALDADLYAEAEHFSAAFKKKAKKKLAKVPFDLGGGGFYTLIYFLVRHRKPSTVVETGVASGFSSQSFLSALDKNGHGALYSSDFPYFRMDNPERYVGYLVDEPLKSRWTLNIKGDRFALPEIMAPLETVDLFHYDSDKSYDGRRFAMEQVTAKMPEGSCVIMDDIQDNLFFRDWVQKTGQDFMVFEFNGKYIGFVPHFRA